jgi:hypothetical protein
VCPNKHKSMPGKVELELIIPNVALGNSLLQVCNVLQCVMSTVFHSDTDMFSLGLATGNAPTCCLSSNIIIGKLGTFLHFVEKVENPCLGKT